ncbi:glycosyltransferase family 2 protein [Lacticaseibacillus paracasei]|jgi:hypothetical protein|uniref:glycosyltransferase family 2 protein n=1 Tax=Lacticaseibacillus paracasei TaxID=1597 RepID=UPI00237EF617|nr:glycosyltransferase family 2 protein [Lacticaseibacillus paracasei]MDE3285615.1 glycosyltransferase family 2 protein [Lacticaseibacillus paracasei]
MNLKNALKKLLFKKDKPDRYPDHSRLLRISNLVLSCSAGFPKSLKEISTFGVKKYAQQYPDRFSGRREPYIVCIVKDEADYIEEWLAFHHLMGIKGFYIYDNGSTDETRKIIKKYAVEYNIQYIYYPGDSMQSKAYMDAVRRTRNKHIWLLTIDADEFLVSVNGERFADWLAHFSNKDTQILIGWMMFGSSGEKFKKRGLVIDRFKHHATNEHIASYKAVVKPEFVVASNMPHMYSVVGRTVDENSTRIWYYPYPGLRGSRPSSKEQFRINHYYTKSLEEYKTKSNRGDAFDANIMLKSMKEFHVQDRNEETDDLLDDMSVQVHKEIARHGDNSFDCPL